MNEITPKISVIVPVYKAENYLHHCVDSLLAQTLQDFELLLIDDGSPDRSGEICDEYARKDNRVRVFHKENGGVSSARQCGMDNARGEYTIHADPDDWVEPSMLEELYKKAKEEDADMVICDFYEERRGKTIYIKQQPSSLDQETVLRELFQQLHGSCWNKLVRQVCYKKYKIRFPIDVNYCEDLYMCIALLQCPIKVVYLNKAFYHYNRYANDNSITNSDRKSMYNKINLFYKSMPQILDPHIFEYEYLCIEFRLAFAAIVANALSTKHYKEHFVHLKQYMHKRKFCTIWEKYCIKASICGFLPIARILVELRHCLGNVKCEIIKYSSFGFRIFR